MSLLMTVTCHPNSNAKSYTLEVAEMSEWDLPVMFAPPFNAHAPGWGQIGYVGRGLLYPLFQAQRERLMIIFLDPGHLSLVKQGAASWEEIDPTVAEAAARVFGKKVELIQLH